MAARLSRKTQILLGVKFKPELIFSVFVQMTHKVYLGSSLGSISWVHLFGKLVFQMLPI